VTAVAHAYVPENDLEALAAELDRIRADVLADLGADDAAYIRRVVATQRRLEMAGRATLFASLFPPAWLAGTALLATAKILENMEIGHNVMHGQWDWMRDPRIHSTTWEWDHATPADQWKHSHNYVHHTYTNVVGKDRDVGYGLLRIAEDQPWAPQHLVQLATNAVLAVNFEWGVAVYDAEIEAAWRGEKPWREVLAQLAGVWRKGRRQLVKDYVAFPLLAGPGFVAVLTGNLSANVVRNLWTHTVIFCGHFSDGVAFFDAECLTDETRGEWYLRQVLGSADISGPPLLHLMTGNLSHQIEHHLFPDLPSNRYAEIAPRVREVCEKFGLPYNSASLPRQVARSWGRVARMSLPNSLLPDALTPKAVGKRLLRLAFGR
jgi:fatty acid desaturase